MLKYCFKVFDRNDSKLITQLIVPAEYMWSTLENLQEIGVVKGFVIDEEGDESDV